MTCGQVVTPPDHLPVMVPEVLSHLITDPSGIYVDGTIGLGGHSNAILSKLNHSGRLIGIDRDNDALEQAKQNLSKYNNQFSVHKNSYAQIDEILQQEGFKDINGILLDLGLSSYQLAVANRGFSFSQEGELDMRFDQNNGLSAREILNSHNETEIADFIRLYSEERFAKKIAYNIKKAEKMNTVADLKEAIRRSTPPDKRNRSFARVFQAIRIVVNDELDQLNIFLEKIFTLLRFGARIVILSFHSLEDRLVKFAFRNEKSEGRLSIITKKPLIATSEEILVNTRAKSAKLRAAEKI